MSKETTPEELLVKQARRRLRIGSGLDASARAIGSLIGVLLAVAPYVFLGLALHAFLSRLVAAEAQLRLLVEMVDELRKAKP